MRQLLSFSLICLLATNVYATEVISSFDNQNISVLNDELRKLESDINSIDVSTSALTGILPLVKGGTETAMIAPTADASLYWDYSSGEMAWTSTTFDTYSRSQIFTADGNFTVPAGITKIFITMVGGGGSGGGESGPNTTGGGGGGGAGIKMYPLDVTPLAVHAVQIGDGGVDSAGQASIFDTGTAQITVNGGSRGGESSSGVGGLGGVESNNLTAVTTTVGTYIGGAVNAVVGGSGSAGVTGSRGGYGGGSIMGIGGAGAAAVGNGTAGTGYGGGGGGARRDGGGAGPLGGNGTSGIGIIRW